MSFFKTKFKKEWMIISVAAVAILIIWFHGPISQDVDYNDFVDQRMYFGLPNTWNVASNIAFILVGGTGIIFLTRLLIGYGFDVILVEYLLFFIGVTLTGVGSAYYHYNPTDESLVWDRLPMAIAFMSFFCSVISERINRKAGAAMLLPLLVFGILSVLYWTWGEKAGHGDLRMYVVVQFVPMILVIAILLLYESPKTYWTAVVSLLVMYFVAKVCESFDGEIYAVGNILSGHTLKHLFAALGTFCILKMLYSRRAEFSALP